MITLMGYNSQFSKEVKLDQKVWAGGEVSVKIDSPVYSYSSFTITANIHNSEDFMQLVMLTDALRRVVGNLPISLTIPYFPYARQDRVCNPGEAHGARVFADLINALKFERVTVWDAHSYVTEAVLDRCENLHCEEFVRWIPGVEKMTLVAPDAGAAKKVAQCAKLLGSAYAAATKVRDPHTGNILETHLDVRIFSGHVLMVDDICDGGRTFIELAKVIRPKMKADAKLYLYVTHGIFSYGVSPLVSAGIDKVFCANPWQVPSITAKGENYIERIKQL